MSDGAWKEHVIQEHKGRLSFALDILVIDILIVLIERIFESLEINYANSLPIDLIERSIKEKV